MLQDRDWTSGQSSPRLQGFSSFAGADAHHYVDHDAGDHHWVDHGHDHHDDLQTDDPVLDIDKDDNNYTDYDNKVSP